MPLKREHSDYGDKTAESAVASNSTQTLARSFMPSDPDPTGEGRVRARRKSKAIVEGAESDNSSDHNVRSRKKVEPVKSACIQCQRRKTKCSGQRPTCLFCSERDLVCLWENSDGMTRTADLKQNLQDATARSDDLDMLVDAMRNGTNEVSTMLLAKLRLGASVEELVQNMKQEPALTENSYSRENSYSPSELACPSNLSEM